MTMDIQFRDESGHLWLIVRRSRIATSLSPTGNHPKGSTKRHGLQFRNLRTGEVRFLAYPEGAAPRDRELELMYEEVLQALLAQAE